MKFSPAPLVIATGLAAASPGASAEPPDLKALACTVAQQDAGDTIRMRVRFDNQGATPLELPPGPHLVFYADAAATDRFDLAARMDRIQKTPIVIPPEGSTEALFAVSKATVASLGCTGAQPAVAAMYFYKFSQRPQFRCVLRQFDVHAATGSGPCPPAKGASRSDGQ